MLNKTNVPGLDGFVWWTGIVEGRKDPDKLSRVQVRMFIWHTDDKTLIPSDHLFWAIPVFPSNSSNDTYCPREGDAVFGFWIDNKEAQQPYIFGRFPDKPTKLYPPSKGFSDPGTNMGDRPVEVRSRTMVDGEGVKISNGNARRYPNPLNEQTTSRFARNENIDKTPLPFIRQNIKKGIEVAGGITWDEVDPDYKTVYPYNDSKMSESGHFFDIDDTKNHERVNLMHRTGTMYEIRNTGTVHKKDLKHNVNLVHGSDLRNIRGNLWTTTERWTRYRSKGRTLVEINADAKVSIGGTLNLNIQGDLVVRANGKIYIGAVGLPSEISNPTSCGGDDIVLSPQDFPLTLESTLTTLIGVEAQQHYHPYADGVTGGPIGKGYTARNWQVSGSAGDIPEWVGYGNAKEAKFGNEIKTSCKEDPENPTKKLTKEQMMKNLLAVITGPGAGGTGENWCYTDSSGKENCIFTHHATSDCSVETYIWCDGGNCYSTSLGKKNCKPAGWTCPLDPGGDGQVCGGEIDATQDPNA